DVSITKYISDLADCWADIGVLFDAHADQPLAVFIRGAVIAFEHCRVRALWLNRASTSGGNRVFTNVGWHPRDAFRVVENQPTVALGWIGTQQDYVPEVASQFGSQSGVGGGHLSGQG